MKKGFGKKKKLAEEANLNITAMASIFVVILVFLLKSVSTDVATVTPSQNLVLPEIKEAQDVEDALKIEISSDSIVVDQKPVVKLEGFKVDAKDVGTGGALTAVMKAIEEEKINHITEEAEADRKIVIIADQKTPFETIKRVIASTSAQGFMNLRLMVVKEP